MEGVLLPAVPQLAAFIAQPKNDSVAHLSPSTPAFMFKERAGNTRLEALLSLLAHDSPTSEKDRAKLVETGGKGSRRSQEGSYECVIQIVVCMYTIIYSSYSLIDHGPLQSSAPWCILESC